MNQPEKQVDIDLLCYVNIALTGALVILRFNPWIALAASLYVLLLIFVIRRQNWARRSFLSVAIATLPFNFIIPVEASQAWTTLFVIRSLTNLVLILRLLSEKVRAEFTSDPVNVPRRSLGILFTTIGILLGVVAISAQFEGSPVRNWLERASLKADEETRNALHEELKVNIPHVDGFYFRNPVRRADLVTIPVTSAQIRAAALLVFGKEEHLENLNSFSKAMGEGWNLQETERLPLDLILESGEQVRTAQLTFTIEGVVGNTPPQLGYESILKLGERKAYFLSYAKADTSENLLEHHKTFLKRILSANPAKK